MCSIYGAMGLEQDMREALPRISDLYQTSMTRGRDGSGFKTFSAGDKKIFIGNHRASPTTEKFKTDLQPYGGFVHNGTIENDEELGNPPGEIDSKILQHVVRKNTLENFAQDLDKIHGSFAIACYSKQQKTTFLACNYKPIYVLNYQGVMYFASLEEHLLHLCHHGVRPMKIKPYTAMDLWTGKTIVLNRKQPEKYLVVASAGLDSTMVASQLVSEGKEVHLLHFTYGCKAEKNESELIPKIAERLGCSYSFMPIDFKNIGEKSALFGNDDGITQGKSGAEYAYEWVPARNLVMMSLAVAYAEENEFGYIALGNNLEEAGAYPDNEEEFFIKLNEALDMAVQNGVGVRIVQPAGNLMKHEIVKKGVAIGAPFELTWSCYKQGEKHCGQCAPCFMRKTAFERNGLSDPVMEN